MAVPKKKVSPGRRNMRRFSYKYRLDIVTIGACPSCSEPVKPHSVCKCGHYGAKMIFQPRVKVKPEESAQQPAR